MADTPTGSSTRRSAAERLAELKAKEAQLKARRQALEARVRQTERKRRTRRHIQLGGILAAWGLDSTEQAEALLEEIAATHQPLAARRLSAGDAAPEEERARPQAAQHPGHALRHGNPAGAGGRERGLLHAGALRLPACTPLVRTSYHPLSCTPPHSDAHLECRALRAGPRHQHQGPGNPQGGGHPSRTTPRGQPQLTHTAHDTQPNPQTGCHRQHR